MRTWSIEESVIRAQAAVAVAVQGVWDKLVAVERVTRPPRLGHDWDLSDPDDATGAEWLADLEAEIDSWEPDELLSPYGRSLTADEREPEEVGEPTTAPAPWKVLIDGAHGCSITLEDSHGGDGVWLYSRTAVDTNRAILLPEDAVRELRDALFIRCAMVAAGIPNPSEYDDDPMVSDSYLRYNEVESGHDMGARLAAEMFPQYTTSSPAAGARAAGFSPSEVSGPSSPPWPPSEGCTNPPQATVAEVRGEGGAPDSGIQRPPGAPQPDPTN